MGTLLTRNLSALLEYEFVTSGTAMVHRRARISHSPAAKQTLYRQGLPGIQLRTNALPPTFALPSISCQYRPHPPCLPQTGAPSCASVSGAASWPSLSPLMVPCPLVKTTMIPFLLLPTTHRLQTAPYSCCFVCPAWVCTV